MIVVYGFLLFAGVFVLAMLGQIGLDTVREERKKRKYAKKRKREYSIRY